MNIHFRHASEAKRLPKTVQEYMRRRFILLPDYLETLRCFEYDGEVNGRPVRLLRIFSPAGSEDELPEIKTRQDLEQHPERLLFIGHIDKHGEVYVADRRTKYVKARAG